MDLTQEFRSHLTTLRLPPGRALVAVSGGPDSVALLDLLVRSQDVHELELVVAHIDHGIHPESAQVAAQVCNLARHWGIEFESIELALGATATETQARARRYAWLEQTRKRAGAVVVFTAHHADDQVETILMRALEGSGPTGLAAMSGRTGALVRPLLPFPREALAAYARERSLPTWSDPANHDSRHLRSWLRCAVLPKLRSRLPRVDLNLARVGAQAARDRTAWSKVLDLLPGLDPLLENGGISVAAAPLRGYDSALAQTLLIAIGRRVGCQIGAARAARILRLLAAGNSGSETPLCGQWRAELAFDRLRLIRAGMNSTAEALPLDAEAGEMRWGEWRFRWRREPAPALQERAALTAWFEPDALTIRGWLPGEKVRPLAGAGRRLLVRCFQEARVPRRRRENWPVLVSSDAVVWIPGVCRSDALVPSGGKEALRIDAEYA